MLAPPLAATVSSVMSLGFTARETIPIVFFGFAICSVVVTLTGKMVRPTVDPGKLLKLTY
jgi:nucleobase:cation symporter-1, NCS1 family